jgi:hypothetical protein
MADILDVVNAKQVQAQLQAFRLDDAMRMEAEVDRRVGAEIQKYRMLEAVYEAAKALIDSGYDGPFMGDRVAELFAAVIRAEKT